MSRYSKQKFHCLNCGKEIETELPSYHPFVWDVTCGDECRKQYEWKWQLSVLGLPFMPDPRKEEDRGVRKIAGAFSDDQERRLRT